MKLQNTISKKFSIVLFLAMFVLTLPLAAAAQEKIAFSSERDGFAPEIYTMNPDGTGQMRLTNNSALDIQPSCSPDGSKIAFVRSFDIYVMNADGSNQTQLTTNPAVDQYPSFSPDGAKIVFSSLRNGSEEIYVINADGTQETRLTNNSAEDFQPEFSRDGSKIVFVSRRDGNDEIYVMNVNGTDPARLTNNPARDFDPTFNHDDSKIAFTSQRDVNDDVFLMNADGSAPTNLTNNTPGSHFDPAFSPDGSQIAFASSRDSGDLEIYVMNADGTLPTRLTNAFRQDRNPSWGGAPSAPPSAPVLSNVLVTSPISENGFAALSGNISDADAGDAFTLTVDWGDGSAPQIFNYPAGTTSFSETHQYLDDNPIATASDSYTIDLSLDDNGRGSDTDSTTVTVNNSAPVLSGITANPSTVAVGGTTTLSGSVSDAGTLDTHTIQINWGDGSPVTTLNLAAGAGGFSASHQYNSGRHSLLSALPRRTMTAARQAAAQTSTQTRQPRRMRRPT